ncbi:MAG: hypothetical protein FGM31_02980 [Candidatus Methylopumilus sp.]|nr:hypothetical protein [Candidatus Methylopumilus sp.]
MSIIDIIECNNSFLNNKKLVGLSSLNTWYKKLTQFNKSGRWFIVRLARVRDELELADLKTRLEKHGIEYMIVAKKS